MKNLKPWLFAMLVAIGLLGFQTWAATCTASPDSCSETATVTIPPGGSCWIITSTCTATAASYDAAGNLYESNSTSCPDCGPLVW